MQRMNRWAMGLAVLCVSAAALPGVGARGEVVMDVIDYQQGDQPLRGYLFYDNANEKPRPGVMVIPEWWGCNEYARWRAKQLAEMGYVAFAADMYGPDKVTKEGEKAAAWSKPLHDDPRLMRDRAEAGLDELRRQALCHDQPLAAIGFCFGGGAVEQMACDNPEGLVAVVSFHGDPAPPTKDDPEHIKPAFLFCHGKEDPFVPVEQLQKAVDGLKAHDASVKVILYDEAKHSFTNPEADGSFNPGAIYNEKAAKKAWKDMSDFLAGVFDAAGSQAE